MSGRAASAGSLKSRMEGLGRGAARAFLWHRPCSTDLHEPRSSDDPRVAQRGLPRERFVTKEAETLSDAECLGLLFGVQSSRTHRADQAQALFAAFGSLAEIADREVQEVDWIGRLGVAKPARLGAATELCRRLRARPRTGRCGGRVPRRRPATSARTSRAKRRKCSARRSSTIRTGSSATSGSPKGAGRRPPSIPARSSVPRFLEAAAHLVLVPVDSTRPHAVQGRHPPDASALGGGATPGAPDPRSRDLRPWTPRESHPAGRPLRRRPCATWSADTYGSQARCRPPST